jgi:hypothetical protein
MTIELLKQLFALLQSFSLQNYFLFLMQIPLRGIEILETTLPLAVASFVVSTTVLAAQQLALVP